METEESRQIQEYYALGLEEQRLKRGIAMLEFARMQEIIQRCLPLPPAVVYDVGGGAGAYSLWLARLGYVVHLFDLVPDLVRLARKASACQPEAPIARLEVADGRRLDREDGSADAVLLMGPLYHLPERAARLDALTEARRVLKPGGVLIAAAISRFGSLLWGISTFGAANTILAEPAFQEMIRRELADGQHLRPPEYPGFIARAYFHLPDELRSEVSEAGFQAVSLLAVEGPCWIAPNFSEVWADEQKRAALLDAARLIESQPALMGVSPHLVAIGYKPN
ncbi:MAG TPA: class I SAM-dependent methyltransferase [Anaerolineaceae bacterium]